MIQLDPITLSGTCPKVRMLLSLLDLPARSKVQAAEDAWNTRRPDVVALAYSENSNWRNRDRFFTGREAIRAFLTDKWTTELHYRLKKTNIGNLLPMAL